MPFLKFRCTSCNKVFDALVSASAIDRVICESCGAAVERAYEGACRFGMQASPKSCEGSCDAYEGCGSSSHGGGCPCSHCH